MAGETTLHHRGGSSCAMPADAPLGSINGRVHRHPVGCSPRHSGRVTRHPVLDDQQHRPSHPFANWRRLPRCAFHQAAPDRGCPCYIGRYRYRYRHFYQHLTADLVDLFPFITRYRTHSKCAGPRSPGLSYARPGQSSVVSFVSFRALVPSPSPVFSLHPLYVCARVAGLPLTPFVGREDEMAKP